jgi:hypothetical protein
MAIFKPFYIRIFENKAGAEDEFGASTQQLHKTVVSRSR